MRQAARETNANQRLQFIQSFNRLFGRDQSQGELAEFDAAQRALGFIDTNFNSAGLTPLSPASEPLLARGGSTHSGEH